MTEQTATKNGKRLGKGPRVEGGSPGARQWAAVILQVLAGEWTPGDGAQSLGVSLPRYYAVESHAMSGLVQGCEPRNGKRRRGTEKEVTELKNQVLRLERECARKQALLRASQRVAGMQPIYVKKTKGKRRRRPTVRALKVATALRSSGTAMPETEASGA